MSASADILWTSYFAGLDAPPYPSLSDALWLAFYPLSYAGVVLLLRSRVRSLPAGLWLDGVIAALGASALVAAVVLEPVLASAVEGAAAAVATNLAYPVGDLVLLAVVLWAFGCMGWRPDRQWLMLGAGLVCTGAGDTGYLAAVAHGTYAEGGLLDLLWPVGSLLMAWAAWQPRRRRADRCRGRARVRRARRASRSSASRCCSRTTSTASTASPSRSPPPRSCPPSRAWAPPSRPTSGCSAPAAARRSPTRSPASATGAG